MEKKSGAVSTLWMCLIVFIVGHVQSDVKYVETGTGYNFTPSVTKKPESILWKFKNNKLVEFDSGGTTWYRFKGRGSLDNQTGELQLHQLFNNESGSYQADIQVSGRVSTTKYDIEVRDAVSKPVVKCEVNDEEIKLWCSANFSTVLKWDGPDGFKSTGANITVSKGTDPKSVYICTAENELEQKAVKSKIFTLEECFSGQGVDIATAVTIPLVLILAIVGGIGGFFYYKKKSENTNQGSELKNKKEEAPLNVESDGKPN